MLEGGVLSLFKDRAAAAQVLHNLPDSPGGSRIWVLPVGSCVSTGDLQVAPHPDRRDPL